MDYAHLVIGGVNKAGTTSMYRYLSAHPDVCTAVVKQSFWFLDPDLQKSLGLRSLHPYSPEPGAYERLLFPHLRAGQRTLDASPEYLFSPGTPERIHHTLGDTVGIVFLLRDPAERMVSLYRFGKQQGLLPVDMPVDTFIDAARAYRGVENPCLMAYATGHYSTYLERWLDRFGPEAVQVHFFEDLVADPRETVTRLAAWAGLDPEPFADIAYEAHNVTVDVRSQRVRSAYLALRDVGFRASARWTPLRRVAEQWRRFVSPLHRRINTRTRTHTPDEATAAARIAALFEGEAERLGALVGRRPPWR